MAGLVPAISFRDALCSPKRDRRVKLGDDKLSYAALVSLARTRPTNSAIAASVAAGASRCGE
jgi:hypothetical protein